MRFLNCQKCGADVPLPEIDGEDKRIISDVAHRTTKMHAIIELRERAGLGLKEAKAIALHLSEDGLRCHRCNSERLAVEFEGSPTDYAEVFCVICGWFSFTSPGSH